MSFEDMVERLVVRVAGLSEKQKEEAVKKVMTNLEAKDKKVNKDKSKKTKKDTESKSKKKDEQKEEETEVEKSEMSDDVSMDAVEALSKELEQIKQDGKVDSSEILSLFQSMMGMVNELLMAKPGSKPKASIADRVAARGLQVRRKDQDLMSDTGGVSKGRGREPENKPPREDSKKNNRTKNKPAVDRDKDTDKDSDMKACVHEAMDDYFEDKLREKGFADSREHPLDRKSEMWGMAVPEENYHRRVWSLLVDVLAAKRGVSEKAFEAYGEVMKEADGLLRTPEAMDVVGRFESEKKRPDFCAEYLFDSL